jgi:hypothetical protein
MLAGKWKPALRHVLGQIQESRQESHSQIELLEENFVAGIIKLAKRMDAHQSVLVHFISDPNASARKGL